MELISNPVHWKPAEEAANTWESNRVVSKIRNYILPEEKHTSNCVPLTFKPPALIQITAQPLWQSDLHSCLRVQPTNQSSVSRSQICQATCSSLKQLHSVQCLLFTGGQIGDLGHNANIWVIFTWQVRTVFIIITKHSSSHVGNVREWGL